MARAVLTACACAALLVGGVRSAAAQHAHRVELSPGADVRLHPEGGRRARGEVLWQRGDTVALGAGRGRAAIVHPLSELRKLEVRGGRNRAAGAARGAAALALVAAVFGALDGVPADEWVAGVLGNAAVGGVAGVLIAPRGWIEVPLPRR